MKDATFTLAENIVRTKYGSIPAEAVEATKKQILDSIGVALAGSSAPGIKPLVELVKELGGREESTIFSYGGKVPALHAAQANASMVHAVDYDDTHEGALLHPSVAVVPTALAMAERRGGVDGKELIAAIALGNDLSCRLGAATRIRNQKQLQGGWHFTPLYGYFSAAATAGRILGLDEEKMVNALGIAYHQAAGNLLFLVDGALTKRMGAGFAVRGGILAALLAEKGITGSKNILETPDLGLYGLYHAGYDRDKLIDGLGKRFEGARASLKLHPSGRANHHYIDVTLEIVRENDIKPEELREIICGIHQQSAFLFLPTEIKHNPRDAVDCQFSMPWVLACAVVRRKVGLAEFTEAAIKDSAIRRIAQKVTYVIDTSLPSSFSWAPVTIKTSRGDFSKRGGAVLGSPENPLSRKTLIDKFKECNSWGIKPLPGDAIDKIVDMIDNLEKLNDVSLISQMLG